MRLIFIILFLVGCGSDDTKRSDDTDPVQDTGEIVQEITENPNSEVAETSIYSAALNTANEMAACEKTNDKQLVYIIESDTFFTCQSSEWVEIEIGGNDYNKWQWYDKKQGLLFEVMNFTDHDGYRENYLSDCSRGYRVPKLGEFEAAIAGGMLKYFDSLDFEPDDTFTDYQDDYRKYWFLEPGPQKMTFYTSKTKGPTDSDGVTFGFTVCIKFY